MPVLIRNVDVFAPDRIGSKDILIVGETTISFDQSLNSSIAVSIIPRTAGMAARRLSACRRSFSSSSTFWNTG